MTSAKQRPRVYVAGPLSSSGSRLANVEIAMEAGRKLITAGLAPLIPHLTHFMDPNDALGYENHIEVCLAWVRVSQAILRLPGRSSGAEREVALARELSIPVYENASTLVYDYQCGVLGPYAAPTTTLTTTATTPPVDTEPCCECGDDYPRRDLIVDGEIFCPKCRITENCKKAALAVSKMAPTPKRYTAQEISDAITKAAAEMPPPVVETDAIHEALAHQSVPGMYVVKDSGKREDFDTGSRRDTRAGKGRFDLLSPISNLRLARHFETGSLKYGDRNWEKGQPLCRYLDSAIRHLNDYLAGDRSEDHVTAASWNCHCFVHTEEMIRRGVLPATLNDLPEYPQLPTPSAISKK